MSAGAGTRSAAELFADDLVERVAGRVAEMLADRLAVPAPGSPWLNVEEAGEYLRCRPKRIYDLVSQRRIPAHRDGSRLLFRRDELDVYIMAAEDGAGAALARAGVRP